MSNPALLVESPTDILTDVSCRIERFDNMLSVISEMLHEAAVPEIRPEAVPAQIYSAWMLLVTARESFSDLDRRFHEAEEAVLKAARPRTA